MSSTSLKAIPYVRFSSISQGKGSSVERQQQYVNEWLKAHPDVLLSDLTFSDLGKSGYHGKHLDNDLGKLLAAIESGHIKKGDYILIEAMDRLGRLAELEMLSIIQQICKAGVKIVTLQDGTEYSNEAIANNGGLLYLLVGKVQQAHHYSKQLSERLSKAWETKVDKAKSGQGVKRKAPWWVSWNDSTERYDVVTEEDKETLTLVFKLYLNGLGERRILKRLREKAPDKFGTTDPATVKRWLSNKTAIGYWQDIPKVYPAAVSESLFYKVQQELKVRKAGRGQTPRSGRLLAGLVKCGCCGGNYSIRSNPHSRDAMLCSVSNKRKDKCTNSKTIPYQILDWVRHQTYYEAMNKVHMQSLNGDVDEKLAVIDGELESIESQLTNLIDLVAIAGMTNELKTKFKYLNGNKEELSIERVGLVQTITETPEVNHQLLDEISFDHLSPEEVNKSLQNVGYSIMVKGRTMECEGVKVTYKLWSRIKDEYILIDENSGEEFTIPVMREPTKEELSALDEPPKAVYNLSSEEDFKKMEKLLLSQKNAD